MIKGLLWLFCCFSASLSAEDLERKVWGFSMAGGTHAFRSRFYGDFSNMQLGYGRVLPGHVVLGTLGMGFGPFSHAGDSRKSREHSAISFGVDDFYILSPKMSLHSGLRVVDIKGKSLHSRNPGLMAAVPKARYPFEEDYSFSASGLFVELGLAFLLLQEPRLLSAETRNEGYAISVDMSFPVWARYRHAVTMVSPVPEENSLPSVRGVFQERLVQKDHLNGHSLRLSWTLFLGV